MEIIKEFLMFRNNRPIKISNGLKRLQYIVIIGLTLQLLWWFLK